MFEGENNMNKKIKLSAGIIALATSAVLIRKAYKERTLTLIPGKHHVKKIYNLDDMMNPMESPISPKGYREIGLAYADLDNNIIQYNYVNYKTVLVKANKMNEFGKIK